MIVTASICAVIGLAALAIFLSTYQSSYGYGWGLRTYFTPRCEDLLAGAVGIAAFVYGLAAGIMTLKRRNYNHCMAGGLLIMFKGVLIVFAFATQWSNSWIVE
jgi:hypothetical protein